MFNDRFPREIGIPNRIGVANNKQEFQGYIDKHIHNSNMYTTVYAFRDVVRGSKPIYSSAIVDKLFFDFDPEPTGQWFEDVQAFIDMLDEKNIKFSPIFSGGGIHIYVKTRLHDGDHKLTNPKFAVGQAQDKLIKMSGVDHVDTAIIGDIARITRIPNTFNHKQNRKRWCIPLRREDIEKGISHIKDIAQEQGGINGDHETIRWYNNVAIDISKYDNDRAPSSMQTMTSSEDFKPNMGKDWDEIDWDAVPCVVRALETGEPDFHERFVALMYMKVLGVSYESAIDCLEHFLTLEKFSHAMGEGANGSPYKVYTTDYQFPSHRTRIQKGPCRPDCDCDVSHLYDVKRIMEAAR